MVYTSTRNVRMVKIGEHDEKGIHCKLENVKLTRTLRYLPSISAPELQQYENDIQPNENHSKQQQQ